jgi:hypothetical protein
MIWLIAAIALLAFGLLLVWAALTMALSPWDQDTAIELALRWPLAALLLGVGLLLGGGAVALLFPSLMQPEPPPPGVLRRICPACGQGRAPGQACGSCQMPWGEWQAEGGPWWVQLQRRVLPGAERSYRAEHAVAPSPERPGFQAQARARFRGDDLLEARGAATITLRWPSARSPLGLLPRGDRLVLRFLAALQLRGVIALSVQRSIEWSRSALPEETPEPASYRREHGEGDGLLQAEVTRLQLVVLERRSEEQIDALSAMLRTLHGLGGVSPLLDLARSDAAFFNSIELLYDGLQAGLDLARIEERAEQIAAQQGLPADLDPRSSRGR